MSWSVIKGLAGFKHGWQTRMFTSLGTRRLEVVVTYPFKTVGMVKDPSLGLPNSLKVQEKWKNVFYLKNIYFTMCTNQYTLFIRPCASSVNLVISGDELFIGLLGTGK